MAQVEHSGVVREITPSSIIVDMLVHSACAHCHIKGACQGSSDVQERQVEVYRKDDKSYVVGEKVKLFFSESTGLIAVGWAYAIPVVIILLTLALASAKGMPENYAALFCMLFIFAYFITLYIFRGQFRSKIKIRIEKLD